MHLFRNVVLAMDRHKRSPVWFFFYLTALFHAVKRLVPLMTKSKPMSCSHEKVWNAIKIPSYSYHAYNQNWLFVGIPHPTKKNPDPGDVKI